MGIALFEDSHWQNFTPITLTKATFDIKVGARSFFEEYNNKRVPEILLTREYLAGVTGERHTECRVNPTSIDNDIVFINGMLPPGAIDLDRLQGIQHTFAITTGGGRLVVARLGSRNDIEYLQECVATGKKLNVKKLDVQKSTQLQDIEEGLLSEPWDIIRVLENSLAMQVSDLGNGSGGGGGTNTTEKIRIIGEDNAAIIDQNAEAEEGTVLDTRNGGIYIGPEAHVVAPSRIVGPTYIGGKTLIKQFTIIESSYIGYNCKIAGEIEHSIISDYSNKAHAGFVGHSYVGEWVNIGAMTTTSDLKMTYGNIKMNSTNGKKVDTGQNKIGSFFADMSKTSIGTLIYSGRRIGVSSHLHGLIAQDVPSFTIYGSSIGAKNAELQLNSAVETQRKMMSRRGQMISKAYERMIEDIFGMTAGDRRRCNVRKTKFAL
jgi:UDP-N-acetylglucosamine diphosphorylase/glucosamine-1-phosphate N-acetyltransferase